MCTVKTPNTVSCSEFLWIKSCRIHDNAETSNLLQTEEHYSTTRETLMSIENGNLQIKCKTFINYF